MIKADFDSIVTKLETYFPRLDEAQKPIYFNSLKKFSPEYIPEACQNLFETCHHKYFPNLAEIIDAFSDAYNNAPMAHIEDLGNACPDCEGQGLIIDDKNKVWSKAVYCKCAAGRKRFEAHGRYFEEHNLFIWKEKHVWDAYKKARRIR